MQFEHRCGMLPTPIEREKLQSLGVEVLEPGAPLVRSVVIRITEDHPGWPYVNSLIREKKCGDFLITNFSKGEKASAPFLKLGAWHHGYPMPSADFGYTSITYDPNSYCKGNPSGTGLQRVGLCNMGMVQVTPFRMKAEPKWGKKHLLQLNWVFGEFFVRSEIWQRVFKPLGIDFYPVLHYKTGKQLETVVQLKVDATAPSELMMPPDHPTESCAVCGRTRYHPWTRGFFPSFKTPPTTGHIWKTKEIFGSGGSAWNAVIISATLYREIQEHKLQGITYMPRAPESNAPISGG